MPSYCSNTKTDDFFWTVFAPILQTVLFCTLFNENYMMNNFLLVDSRMMFLRCKLLQTNCIVSEHGVCWQVWTFSENRSLSRSLLRSSEGQGQMFMLLNKRV